MFRQIVLFTTVFTLTFARKCNGYEELCSRTLNSGNLSTSFRYTYCFIPTVVLPFLHNAYAVPSNLTTEIPPNVSQNPGWTIDLQLEDGIRGFELDLAWSNVSGSNVLYMCHGNCDDGIGFKGPMAIEVFKLFEDFLTKNTDEVIKIEFQNDAGISAAELSTLLGPTLVNMAIVPVSPPPNVWPTLEELITTNKRILFTTNNGVDGSHPWLQAGESLFTANHYVYFSEEVTKSIYYPNFEDAKNKNSLESLQRHASMCKAADIQINYLSVDFGRTGDLLKAVAILNGVPPPAESKPLPGSSSDPSKEVGNKRMPSSSVSNAVSWISYCLIIVMTCMIN
ncbi:hypothetical protein HK099_005106 [Clydaea vesicula]|uniref:PLC-like phosphodiesterase n=1 Tax=Clydaea vesicula TaxID=447962 RepID=A0AAD5XZ59_9FUNG|nr:hypothetical protein HK099_005106 [Clydaea vesicula]